MFRICSVIRRNLRTKIRIIDYIKTEPNKERNIWRGEGGEKEWERGREGDVYKRQR